MTRQQDAARSSTTRRPPTRCSRTRDDYSVFELHQKATIPARGTTRFRFAYVQAYKQKAVDKLAKVATATFAGCTVPNVTGKTLTAAKKAITHAGCMVGKITRTTVDDHSGGPRGHQNPKAKTHGDYGAKVDAVVSKG